MDNVQDDTSRRGSTETWPDRRPAASRAPSAEPKPAAVTLDDDTLDLALDLEARVAARHKDATETSASDATSFDTSVPDESAPSAVAHGPAQPGRGASELRGDTRAGKGDAESARDDHASEVRAHPFHPLIAADDEDDGARVHHQRREGG